MKFLQPQYNDSHHRQLAVVLTLILSLLSVSAYAQELTDNRIQDFITTLEKAAAMEPEFEQLDDSQSKQTTDFSRMLSSSIENLQDQDLYDRLERLVQNHGFTSLSEWATTGDRIYDAWIAIEIADQSPALRKEMESALAEIENNPDISAQQKAQMRSAMETGISFTQQASAAPPADIEAVKPHLKALRAIAEQKD